MTTNHKRKEKEPLKFNLEPLIEFAKEWDSVAEVTTKYPQLGVKITITVEPL